MTRSTSERSVCNTHPTPRSWTRRRWGTAVLISEDTDFGALLAHRQASSPSFVLLRSIEPLTPQQQAMLLAANLPTVEKDLHEGAIAVLDRRRLRVRRLPISRE